MLAALDKGVKGGRWFSLNDKVYEERNLRSAYKQVAENGGSAGVDHVSTTAFGDRLEKEFPQLVEELKQGSYRPQAIRRTYIPKLNSNEKRPLGIPTVRDRVVQTAVKHVTEPIFEKEFSTKSYGFRPGRGCKDALREVVRLLKEGYLHVVDLDWKSYFDTIPRDKLMDRVEEHIADGSLLKLIRAFLEQEIMEDLKHWIPEGGTPQGAVISPILANLYLNPLDHQMEEAGYQMVRYADDLVVMCKTQGEADAALRMIREWAEEAALIVHPTKTRIVDLQQKGQGFDFLGYHFGRTGGDRIRHWPREASVKKLRESIRRHTKRRNGHSLDTIIERVNPILRGWYGYFKHGGPSIMREIDGWVRMRLRSILRRRRKRQGRGCGPDHQRWPNTFFAERGLFSLAAAHASA